MEFETTERCGRVHVVKNGVESAWFARRCGVGRWRVMRPMEFNNVGTLEEALGFVAATMNDWYTAREAAYVLVAMGIFDEPPSPQRMTKWCREGLLPGAIKVQGKDGRGSGGAWRIPEAGLVKFAERRRRE